MNKILQVATFAGKIMLESGAETYRVEETICRICSSYGMETTDSFVTPTGIMVSISNNDETRSLIKRVISRGVDLNKVDQINNLSRSVQSTPTDINEFYEQLKKVNEGDRYSLTITLIFSAICAGIFSMLFGGDLKDLLSSALIGFIIKLMNTKFEELSINEFFINAISSALATTLAILLFSLGLASNVDKTVIGSIMLLVPGLAITNAIRDTIAGDYLAGITRAAEATLIAISIAIGTGAVLSIWINTLGGLAI
jgi:uncharacterized membrane protein YjjP (DUF1212 family)